MILSNGALSSPGIELRDWAISQQQKAITILAHEGHSIDHRIYEARKICKRLRALLRLCRPALGKAYQIENEILRDAARLLSSGRDSKVLVETCESLMATLTTDAEKELANLVHTQLANDYLATHADEAQTRLRIEQCRLLLEESLKRIQSLPFHEATGYKLSQGLGRVYQLAYRHYRICQLIKSSHQLHEWRKEVKYYRVHLELLTPLWEPVLTAIHHEAKALASLLGREHDLSVLQDHLKTLSLDKKAIIMLNRLASAQRKTLNKEALKLGARLHSCKPAALERQFRELFKAFQTSP